MVVHCFAYIDPGTSNYLFQLLIAGITTLAFFFSTIKRKVMGFFKKEKPADSAEETTPETSENVEKSEALHK